MKESKSAFESIVRQDNSRSSDSITATDGDKAVRLVISQPMFLPWKGLFDQIKLCTHFVFYDDVQLPLGGGRGRGFTTRVQIKTSHGTDWLSLPVRRSGQGKQLISEAQFADMDWKRTHLAKIEHAYRTAPFFTPVFEMLVEPLYGFETSSIAEFCSHSMQALWRVLGLTPRLYISSVLNVARDLDASERVLTICQLLGATEYISGWGAMNYINYRLFEESGVRIHYMNYSHPVYPQLHGRFTPFVSVLDLMFNVGLDAAPQFIGSECKYWKHWPHVFEGRPISCPV